MKKHVVALISAFLLMTTLGTNSFACMYGCTPGFWKNHAIWPVSPYTPELPLNQVFSCVDPANTTTLLEALQTGGGGLFALQRQAVAALLNSQEFPCFGSPTTIYSAEFVTQAFCTAYQSGDADLIEATKNLFEAENDGACPLGSTYK